MTEIGNAVAHILRERDDWQARAQAAEATIAAVRRLCEEGREEAWANREEAAACGACQLFHTGRSSTLGEVLQMLNADNFSQQSETPDKKPPAAQLSACADPAPVGPPPTRAVEWAVRILNRPWHASEGTIAAAQYIKRASLPAPAASANAAREGEKP